MGRVQFHTDQSKKAIGLATSLTHKKEAEKESPYSFMPRGDNHHRRILGISEETKDKISKALKGRPQPPNHPSHLGINKGKTWNWRDAAKEARSESMKGIKPTNGLTMKGKSHSEETKELMSKSHKEFFTDSSKVEALNALRPRGEDHAFYGKERSEETRAKIAASLTGIVQSEETKAKRSASLALARMPKYSTEELRVLTALKDAPNKEARSFIMSQSKGKLRTLANGLCVILDGRKDEIPRRYWRQAETWLSLNK